MSNFEGAQQGDRIFWACFILIAAVGAFLRFWDLGAAALWMDEAVTMGLSQLPLRSIMFGDIDNHPPLIYVVEHLWVSIFPDPSLYRVPFAFVGSLAVIMMMLMGRNLNMSTMGLIAGMILALSAGQIYYSQDARQYPFILFGAVLATWGALGLGDDARRGQLLYPILYILGGFIAIYSQLSGLVAMAVIGFGALAAICFHNNWLAGAKWWLATNLVLLVLTLPWLLEIPDAVGTFPGMPVKIPVFDIHWHVRTLAGYPGLAFNDLLQLAADCVLFGTALLGMAVAWYQRERALAITVFGLVLVYTAIIAALHIMSPLVHVRIFIPVSIGLALGVGYFFSIMRDRRLFAAGVALFVVLGSVSSLHEHNYHAKQEDYKAAFAFADENGFEDVPVITCLDYSAAAAWEARRDAEIYWVFTDGTLRYPGASYWKAVEMTMVEYRKASRAEIDAYLGGGLLLEGGLETIATNNDKVALFSTGCASNYTEVISEKLQILGFEMTADERIRGNAADYTIIESPVLTARLFKRSQ